LIHRKTHKEQTAMTTLKTQTAEIKTPDTQTPACLITKSNTMTPTKATIAIPNQTIEPPSAWMNQGTSPAELILAIAYILIAQSIVNWSIVGIIQAVKNKR
jgi:hypothetical protein